ncbi:MAG: hypothetical protein Q9160_004819 [Pyrenula sp. 1 TL-2023]
MADKASPSTAAIAIAVAIVAGTVGFFLGQGSSIGLFDSGGNPKDARKSWPNSYDVDVHLDSSDEELQSRGNRKTTDRKSESESEDDSGGEELKPFENNTEEVKLMLIVRTDLGMTKGKIAAQAGHATLACYKHLLNHVPSAPLLRRWERGGQPKIAVQVKSEEELQTLQAQAMSLGLCARVIHDAGRTQIAAGSATVLGVLGPKSIVDQVTGILKLL